MSEKGNWIPCQCCGQQFVSDSWNWYVCDKCGYRICPSCFSRHSGPYAQNGGFKCSQCMTGQMHMVHGIRSSVHDSKPTSKLDEYLNGLRGESASKVSQSSFGQTSFDQPTFGQRESYSAQPQQKKTRKGILLTNTQMLAQKYGCQLSDVGEVFDRYIQQSSIQWELLDLPYSDVWEDIIDTLSKFASVRNILTTWETPLFIVGGDDVIPMPRVESPKEWGRALDADMLYCFDKGTIEFLYEWSSDRNNDDDPRREREQQRIIKLNQSIRFNVSRLPLESGMLQTQIQDDLGGYFSRALQAEKSPIRLKKAVGIAWKNAFNSCREAFKDAPLVNLPSNDDYVRDNILINPGFYEHDNTSKRLFDSIKREVDLLLIILHGGEDPTHPGYGDGVGGTAFSPQMLKETSAKMLHTACCFGARYIGYRREESMLLTGIYSNLLLFMGASNSALGHNFHNINVIDAIDVINPGGATSEAFVHLYSYYIYSGLSAGEAMLKAKIEFWNIASRQMPRKNVLDLILEFNVFGAPNLSAQPLSSVMPLTKGIDFSARTAPRFSDDGSVSFKEISIDSKEIHQILERIIDQYIGLHHILDAYLASAFQKWVDGQIDGYLLHCSSPDDNIRLLDIYTDLEGNVNDICCLPESRNHDKKANEPVYRNEEQSSVPMSSNNGIIFTNTEQIARKYKQTTAQDVRDIIVGFMLTAESYDGTHWNLVDLSSDEFQGCISPNAEWKEYAQFIADYAEGVGVSKSADTPLFIIGGDEVIPIPKYQSRRSGDPKSILDSDLMYCFPIDYSWNKVKMKDAIFNVARLPLDYVGEGKHLESTVEDDLGGYLMRALSAMEQDGIMVRHAMMTSNSGCNGNNDWTWTSADVMAKLPQKQLANDGRLTRDNMFLCPALDVRGEEYMSNEDVSYYKDQLNQTEMLFINLHGSPEKSTSGYLGAEDYTPYFGMTIELMKQLNIPIINAFPCYGARYGKYFFDNNDGEMPDYQVFDRDDSMLLTALYEGKALLFAGSCTSSMCSNVIGNGSEVDHINDASSAIDLLMPAGYAEAMLKLYACYLFQGEPAGKAFLHAKIDYLNYRATFENKSLVALTIHQFNLYGCPTLSCYSPDVTKQLMSMVKGFNIGTKELPEVNYVTEYDKLGSGIDAVLNRARQLVDSNLRTLDEKIRKQLYGQLEVSADDLTKIERLESKGQVAYNTTYSKKNKLYPEFYEVVSDEQGIVKEIIKSR